MEIRSFRNYFLGLMSADDAEALELHIISGEIDEAALIEAENDLIESYLDKKLTNEEIKAFRESFLISNERRSRVAAVSSLMNLLSKPDSQSNLSPNFFERLISFFKLRPISLAFASIAFVLLLGICWQFLFVQKPSGIETELIALNQRDLSDPSTFKDLRSLNLTSDSLRSATGTNGFLEKDLTDANLVRLILGSKIDSAAEFTVKITANGKTLQSFTKASIGQEVRLLLPKSLLTKGEFQITLERNGEKYNYNFTVQ
jgi:hypothetical protein